MAVSCVAGPREITGIWGSYGEGGQALKGDACGVSPGKAAGLGAAEGEAKPDNPYSSYTLSTKSLYITNNI